MKKFLTLILLTVITVFAANNAFAAATKNIAVFSLDMPAGGSSYSLYPASVNMFSSDLVNSLNAKQGLKAMDIYTSRQILKLNNLESKYQKMASEYKNNYVIDYKILDEIASSLDVDYVVLVNGGFDTQSSFLKPNIVHKLQWIWAPMATPSAKFELMTTVVDVQNRSYIYEKSLGKDFNINTFQQPAQEFGENIVPVAQIKKYTRPTAQKIASEIYLKIAPQVPDVDVQTQVHARELPLSQEQTFESEIPMNNQNQVEIQPSTINDARKENYKKWILR
ncbi:MAG: hypothetical protein PHX18_00550 [Candidatus Gastranaerophilales bacterium]|nr:hypothetical protein [Candidatus Gastranaerophilales bacterium]